MNKLIVYMTVIIFFFSMSLSAQEKSADEKATSKPKSSLSTEFSGKLGTAYATQAEKFGLDLSANYIYNVDKYFTVGMELDMFWLNWERTLGVKEIGQTSAAVKAKTDAFVFPFFFNAQVRIPGLFKSVNIIPSLVVGLGWTGMVMSDSIPEYVINTTTVKAEDQINFYGGFSWQCYTSFAYKPDGSDISFIADLGYRSSYPSNSGIEFDMSGFVARIGVKLFYK